MGLVIVVGAAPFPADPHPSWEQYDALADPFGWLLVVLGVRTLRSADKTFDASWWAALTAGAVSVPLWIPQLNHHLDDPSRWALSLPQLVFCFLLTRAAARLAAEQQPPDRYVASRFGILTWAFALLAVLPPIAIGGDVEAFDSAVIGFALLVNVVFVYYLFRVHRRPWLGGAGYV